MPPTDPSRRLWITTACVLGGVASVAMTVPFVCSLAPRARHLHAAAPVEFQLNTLAPGQMATLEWGGKPVWILHRTPQQLASLKITDALVADPHSDRPGFTPVYAKNSYRSRRPPWFVCIGLCTHLGCAPHTQYPVEGGVMGFLCPCHGATFDMAGRVFKNKPASDNLEIPPYHHLNDTRLVIGIDKTHSV